MGDGYFVDVDYSKLTGDAAFRLAKLLYQFPDIVKDAGAKYEPSIVTRHIVNIAQAFNRFYHDELQRNRNDSEGRHDIGGAAESDGASGK